MAKKNNSVVIQRKYIKNSDMYYYNTKAYDGTEFVFQIKVDYRFNK